MDKAYFIENIHKIFSWSVAKLDAKEHSLKHIFFNSHPAQKLCVICGQKCLYLASCISHNQRRLSYDIFYCTQCRTFYTPHELEECETLNNLDWHLSIEERNRRWAQNLIMKLKDENTRVVCEVGCATGWCLDEFRKAGSSVFGFDLHQPSAVWGRNNLNLDIRNSPFDETVDEPFDLLLCIHTLEHINNPNDLLSIMVDACKKNHAKLLLSIPLIDGQLNFLPSLIDIENKDSVFRYAPYHCVHYSPEGMEKMLVKHGALHISLVRNISSWSYFLVSFSDPSITRHDLCKHD